MILHLTKKLADRLQLEPEPLPVEDDFLSWRANYVQERGSCFVVFMNDASRFTVIINKAKAAKIKILNELFVQTLRETLLALGVNPEVIELYIAELGEVTYSKNNERKRISQLNKHVETAWWSLRSLSDDTELSLDANGMIYNTSGIDEVLVPREKMLELLVRYGLPVLKFQALDLNVRLDLNGRDAVRRLRVTSNTTFERLHKLLQYAFEWNDRHLYKFGLFKEWSENNYARPDVEFVSEAGLYDVYEANPEAKSKTVVKLSDYVPEYLKILYIYDFGDSWHHYIEVENVIEDCGDELPVLLSGEGDSPPEDVGGAAGFAEFLEIIADPEHEDYEHIKEWAKTRWWKSFDFELTAKQVSRKF